MPTIQCFMTQSCMPYMIFMHGNAPPSCASWELRACDDKPHASAPIFHKPLPSWDFPIQNHPGPKHGGFGYQKEHSVMHFTSNLQAFCNAMSHRKQTGWSPQRCLFRVKCPTPFSRVGVKPGFLVWWIPTWSMGWSSFWSLNLICHPFAHACPMGCPYSEHVLFVVYPELVWPYLSPTYLTSSLQ